MSSIGSWLAFNPSTVRSHHRRLCFETAKREETLPHFQVICCIPKNGSIGISYTYYITVIFMRYIITDFHYVSKNGIKCYLTFYDTAESVNSSKTYFLRKLLTLYFVILGKDD